MRDMSVAFPQGFELAFPVINGEIVCDNDTETEEWFNKHLDFIQIFHGFKPPLLDCASKRRREANVLRAYILALHVYFKACNMYSVNRHLAYTPDVQVFSKSEK